MALVGALGDEARETDELGKGPDLLLGRMPEAELFLWAWQELVPKWTLLIRISLYISDRNAML